MDLSNSIYEAAKDGNIMNLKTSALSMSREELKPLVNHTRQTEDGRGGTPLTIAAKNGHYEVTQYLVEHCGADVERVGTLTIEGEVAVGAPPLWCAAAGGHLNIMKYLINKAANVNSVTARNSTPLRAACYHGYLDIVKYLVEQGADIEIANRTGHTCLMIASYKGHLEVVNFLIERNADVHCSSISEETVLHVSAESGNLEILKLLLLHGAEMSKDERGTTPLLAAAAKGHKEIVEYLITRNEVLTIERIEALELLGAAFVDEDDDMEKAVEYWIQALELRNSDPRNPITKPVATTKVCAYKEATEVSNVNQLKELRGENEGLQMQALLVRERILGFSHPDTRFYIRYRGAVAADNEDYDRCITLWMYALDIQTNNLDAVSSDIVFSFSSICRVFNEMLAGNRTIKFQALYNLLIKAIAELKRAQKVIKDSAAPPSYEHVQNYSHFVVIPLHIISLLCNLIGHITNDEKVLFKRELRALVKMDHRGSNGQTLLHLAVRSDTTKVDGDSICTFPCIKSIELLIELGASVEAIDLQQNTALHTACMQDNPDRKVVSVLLQANAPTDCVNFEGKRPLEYM